jgi:hypothetical protein
MDNPKKVILVLLLQQLGTGCAKTESQVNEKQLHREFLPLR